MSLPDHVTVLRRDGRRQVLLHRSMALIGPEKVEIKRARSTIVLPLVVLGLAVAAGSLIADRGAGLPFWLLLLLLLFCLVTVPLAFVGLISSIFGAEVVVDGRKGSATWQQGAIGMGLGTKELVPFEKIDHLEVSVEGEEPDRWRGEADALRQFALVLVKKSGKRLTLTQVPVPAYGQADGMDRTLAVANAVAALARTTVRIPEGWEMVEIDTATGERAKPPGGGRGKRRPKANG
jgi:hypothetical protein